MTIIIAKYFLYYIIYSFIGWLMEVTCKLIQLRKFVNRGFLIGPICTIYGYGSLAIILFVGRPDTLIMTFIKSIIVCSLLEYFTSYFMEKLFNARWWDYSNQKLNINGRICAKNMLAFGILGTLVVQFIHPFIINFIGNFSNKVILIVSGVLLLVYLVDNALSFGVMFKIRGEIKFVTKDSTEFIRDKVNKWLADGSFLFRRFHHAYPNFNISLSYLKKRREMLREKLESYTTKINLK